MRSYSVETMSGSVLLKLCVKNWGEYSLKYPTDYEPPSHCKELLVRVIKKVQHFAARPRQSNSIAIPSNMDYVEPPLAFQRLVLSSGPSSVNVAKFHNLTLARSRQSFEPQNGGVTNVYVL